MQNKNTINKEKKLVELAISQGGYFTAKQALKLGYSYRAQSYYLETGYWVKEDRALYKVNFLPYQKDDELIKAYFWTRDKNDIPQAVISHESAAMVHNIGEIIPKEIHLTVPKSFRKKPPNKYKLYKANIVKNEIENKDFFKVTTPIRTITDLVHKIDQEQLTKIIEDSYHKGLINQHDIELANVRDGLKRKLLALFVIVRNKS